MTRATLRITVGLGLLCLVLGLGLALMGMLERDRPRGVTGIDGLRGMSPWPASEAPAPAAPPVADAGLAQTLGVGATATLDGGGSTNAGGGVLSFAWRLASVPVGSAATLSDPAALKPTFVIDLPGDYAALLVVTEGGTASAPDTVTVSTRNSAPFADAGPDRSAAVGDTVRLDGTASGDADGDRLAYRWTLIGQPEGSGAALDDPHRPRPGFVVDVAGTYRAELVVADGAQSSAAHTVTVSTAGVPPVADAGINRPVLPKGMVMRPNASHSTDADGDALGFTWSLVAKPPGSHPRGFGPNRLRAAFIPDLPGDYVIQLEVEDANGSRDRHTIVASSDNVRPLARAGPDQTVATGGLAALDGSGSFDLDGELLSYRWAILWRPTGSAATLSDPGAVQPTLSTDLPGSYVVQLMVSDGAEPSAPDQVVLSTTNSVPVADAGRDQTVPLSRLVRLDGSGSRDADRDPLTYQWALLVRPDASAARLSDPGAARPTFTVDVAGNYVAQLVVRDGHARSAPDTVVLTTGNSRPVAAAGPDRIVPRGNVVQLTSAASSDVDGDPLIRIWGLIARPAGSQSNLHFALDADDPTLTPDLPGDYVAGVLVSDGVFADPPDTVVITVIE